MNRTLKGSEARASQQMADGRWQVKAAKHFNAAAAAADAIHGSFLFEDVIRLAHSPSPSLLS